MPKVFISTSPFGALCDSPLKLLHEFGLEVVQNPLGRRMKPGELAEYIGDADYLVAGTEQIDSEVLDSASNLKLIARVGIGLDGVDLLECKKRSILVSYTPDAPSPAVAELAVGSAVSLMRGIHLADRGLRNGNWNRLFGYRIGGSVVGIIGYGRIGKRVKILLESFGPRKILVCDKADSAFDLSDESIERVDRDYLLCNSDLVTLHLPLAPDTRHFLNSESLKLMKRGSFLVNTSRGGIVDERTLIELLREGHLRGAAIDVFEDEPYFGDLREVANTIVTCHMGSMSMDCRRQMEIEAAREVVEFHLHNKQNQAVPESEYLMRAGSNGL